MTTTYPTTPFERAVDKAIADENQRWVDQPQEVKDQEARQIMCGIFFRAIMPTAMARLRDEALAGLRGAR